MTEKLLRVDEAAERLGLKPATIRARILKRQVPYVKLGRSVRLRESMIMAMIAAGEIPARSKRSA
jgi:excisionase family DNA binding protein